MQQLKWIWPVLVFCTMVGCGGPTAQLGAKEQPGRADKPQTKVSEKKTTTGQSPSNPADSPAGRTRSFQFHYRFSLTGLEPGQKVRMWMPVPTSNSAQQVEPQAYQLPAKPGFHTEPKYKNRILFMETAAPEKGEFTVDVPYRIKRHEIRALQADAESATDRRLTQRERDLFLQPNTRVPIKGKPLELLQGTMLSRKVSALAKQLYELVDRHVTYKKVGTGWGNGDVLWVCDSRYGNCTDFHSLFISLARSQGIPARFEIGFPIPTDAKQGKIGGYHCWALFHTKRRGWVPVDISEADKHPAMKDYYFGSLTPDRVTFSLGRDIELVPKSAAGPLNFFIYPHVEVDGKPLPRKQIDLQFSYADLQT